MKRMWKPTLLVRLWSFRYVFLLWAVKPAVLELSDQRCVIRIPLGWRTRNHLRSMYFGALCIGADIAGGLIAFELIRKQKVRVSFVFKDVRAEFLKRPEADVLFTCEDGPLIQDLLRRTLASGEREEATVRVTATVPEKFGNDAVANFELTLSLRKSAPRPA